MADEVNPFEIIEQIQQARIAAIGGYTIAPSIVDGALAQVEQLCEQLVELDLDLRTRVRVIDGLDNIVVMSWPRQEEFQRFQRLLVIANEEIQRRVEARLDSRTL